ncbi:MAG: hypothetical protein QY331_12875 [Melioribacteraceae bacterium]|nr:MAG: hypothetical protein QY331_12875 [Melioribacteraceae bacterium]
MGKVKAFRIQDEISLLLEKTAKKTNKTETFYVVEALKNYFSEYYDYQVAKDRFEDASDEIITSQEMRKHLGL